MFGPKIKLGKELFNRCQDHAKNAGYSSIEEFVIHVLEKELSGKERKEPRTDEEIKRKLKGLGYLE